MVGKLAPNSNHSTRGLVKYVPGRGYFCAVPSQNGAKNVTSPPPTIVERVLRAFGINADQWTIEAQDEGGWRRTGEQGAEHFMAKWIVAERKKAWTTACSDMPERDGKDQAEDSPKQAGSCWFARPC